MRQKRKDKNETFFAYMYVHLSSYRWFGMQCFHNRGDVSWLAVPSAKLSFAVSPKREHLTCLHEYRCVGGAKGHVNNTVLSQLLQRGRYQCLGDLELCLVKNATLHLHDERLTLVQT